MLAHERIGRAYGAGFYDYPDNGEKHLWGELQSLFKVDMASQLTQDEMVERLLFIQAIETVRCMEENVIRSVADANIGSIFGWGLCAASRWHAAIHQCLWR